MKKLIFTLLILFSVCGLITAQEADISEASAGSGAKTEFQLRIGPYFNYMPVIGSLSNHVKDGLGGGIVMEMDLPVKTPQWIKIGVPIRVVANYHLLKNPALELFVSSQISTGIYARFLLANNNFIIQPELDYGVNLSFARADSYNSDALKPVYIDQCIQASVAFKYAPQQLKKVQMEFELAPTFTLSPVANDLVMYYGARAGVLFRIK